MEMALAAPAWSDESAVSKIRVSTCAAIARDRKVLTDDYICPRSFALEGLGVIEAAENNPGCRILLKDLLCLVIRTD